MELKEIDYIYTAREISDFADCIFCIDEDNYIFKYGSMWAYKDVKKYRYKEEFIRLLCKLNRINKRLHYDGDLTNAPTLSEIEEGERERETLYITIKEKLNGEYSKYYSNMKRYLVIVWVGVDYSDEPETVRIITSASNSEDAINDAKKVIEATGYTERPVIESVTKIEY